MIIDCIKLIKQNAKLNPNCIAVIEGDRKISYLDFINLVVSISNNLLSIHSNPKIAFDLPQSIESYALIIAVLNVGGTYCPLNTFAPSDRKQQIIDEFQPNIFIIESNEEIKSFNAQNITPLNKLLEENNKKITFDYNQESTIYVIYTSGSTGSPKGVMIKRKALNKFLEWSIPTYKARKNDIWGQFSLLSFDLSIVDIFTCLCSGATLLVMADAGSKLRPSTSIEKNKINIWHSIPSAIEFMIKGESRLNADFNSLKVMSFCGETLKEYQLEYLFRKNKDIRVFNTYGPTEGTLFCTWSEFNYKNYRDFSNSSMSIGNPIPGWNILLKETKKPSEKEVIIYGDYIGQGYLRDETISKFKYIEVNGKKFRSFDTGDLVIEKDGNLYFSCRIDRQIKIKGHRVELEEIDYMIGKLLNKVSITIAKNNFLYTFIETSDNIDENKIKLLLSQKIEPYKIPNAIFQIKEIPRNSNLKVNFSALQNLIP